MTLSLSPLYVDEHLLVLDKPAGLLAVPGRTESDCLATRVQQSWPGALVVHRLDMATSGLMVFARTAAAHRTLSMAFAARRVHKRYEAIVLGAMQGDAGRIDLPLGADWPLRPRQKVDAVAGKPAITEWRVMGRANNGSAPATTRVELNPLTGRTHQLRVHLNSIGHPIVGDALYGSDPVPHGRMQLHATVLGLAHPAHGRSVECRSAAPF